MMSLFDEEQIMKSFIRSEQYEAVQESASKLDSIASLRTGIAIQ